MADDYEHMSWCAGVHDEHDECLITVTVRKGDHGYEDLVVEMRGVPCSHVNLYVTGAVFDVPELDAVAAALLALRDRVEVSEGDIDCDTHNHDDDDEEEEEEEEEGQDVLLVCDVCRQPTEAYVLIPAVGYGCPDCCAAHGVAWID